MRILHLDTGRQLYGGARQVLYLMEGLAAKGVDGILACRPDSPLEIAARARGFDVVQLPIRRDLDPAFALRLAGLLRSLRPDLLHVHSRRGADSMGGPAARLTGTPAILSRRIDSIEAPGIGKLKYASYRRIVAVSNHLLRQLREQGVAEHKLELARSAVNAGDCAPTWPVEKFRREFGLEPDDFALGVIARFIPQKGHQHLIEALPRLVASAPRVRVLFFGDGPLESRMIDAVAKIGLSDSVRFAGYRTDLRDFLGHLHLLMHPALREGLGIGVLEAQAAGVPVVGFRTGGLAEAVAETVTGLLVPIGDAEALASAARQLLWNPKRRRQMAAAARDWALQEFDVARMVDSNLRIYQELLAADTRAA